MISVYRFSETLPGVAADLMTIEIWLAFLLRCCAARGAAALRQWARQRLASETLGEKRKLRSRGGKRQIAHSTVKSMGNFLAPEP